MAGVGEKKVRKMEPKLVRVKDRYVRWNLSGKMQPKIEPKRNLSFKGLPLHGWCG